MFREKIIRYIAGHRMFEPIDRVLVALSGGADSVALLCVLRKSGYDCVAAHCNFGLRGEESERDERFVRTLCERLDVPLTVTRFATREYAGQMNISIEMAARDLRYAWFEKERVRCGAKVIAVAHHRDDSVETFLLNLIRGTGINGLKGISPVNGKVVRPMLEVCREEILSYLQAEGEAYVTDSTNLTDEFTRNKIRLSVLPLLAEMNPSVSEAISETSRRLSEVNAVYRHAISEACARVSDEDGSISVEKLRREVAPQAVLFELLHPLGFNASHLKDILACMERGESGKKFMSDGHILLLDRGRLLHKPTDETEKMPVLHREVLQVGDEFIVPKDPSTAYLDADLVKEPLEMRRWQSGDRFVPFGMSRFKKVRDYLRDRKYSLFEKERQQVVTDSGGEIIWLAGERTDNRFRVTPATRRVLVLKIEGNIPTNGDCVLD